MFNDYQHLQQHKLNTREYQQQANKARVIRKNTRKRRTKQK